MPKRKRQIVTDPQTPDEAFQWLMKQATKKELLRWCRHHDVYFSRPIAEYTRTSFLALIKGTWRELSEGMFPEQMDHMEFVRECLALRTHGDDVQRTQAKLEHQQAWDLAREWMDTSAEIVIQISQSVNRRKIRAHGVSVARVLCRAKFDDGGGSTWNHGREVRYSELPTERPVYGINRGISLGLDKGVTFTIRHAEWSSDFWPDPDYLCVVNGEFPVRWIARYMPLPPGFRVEWHIPKTLVYHELVTWMPIPLIHIVLSYAFDD